MKTKITILLIASVTAVSLAFAAGAEGPVIRVPVPPLPKVVVPKPPAPKVKLHVPPSGTRRVVRPYRYDYYPEAQVYFDPGRRLYFFLQANRWLSRAFLPPEIKIHLGPPVIIDLDTDLPYDYHEEVRRIYPGHEGPYYRSSYRAGFDDGYEEGYRDGYNAAYVAGFDQGYRDGYRSCSHDHERDEEGSSRGRGWKKGWE